MKFYNLMLSNKQQFEIDQDDYDKVLEGIRSGDIVKTKQGIFNPSFLVCIIPIEKEGSKIILGHIDEKTSKFIADTYEEDVDVVIPDAFSKEIKEV